MIVTSPSDNGVTLIDNSFIDHYMADANGEFVKIYLYSVKIHTCCTSRKML